MLPASEPAQRQVARLPLLALVALLSAACATAQGGGTPRPFPMPGGPSTARQPDPVAPAAFPGRIPGASATAPPVGLIDTALQLRGVRYRWGGSDLNGFDCSGFTQYVFAQHGLALPREVTDQYREGRSIRSRDIQAGDLLFFSTTDPGASHVAISLGGDDFVHAPSSNGVVRIESLGSEYWSDRFVGARRVE